MSISVAVDYIAIIILAIGAFFNILAGFGLLRFPDVYTRLHAGTKCTTFGAIFICGSVILLGLKRWILGDSDGSILVIHTIGALIAILVTNPTGAHAIARAAHRSGVKPVGAVVDDLEGKPARKSASKRKEAEK
jgi:multicomponent Na+:H+ antiporter subunit G